METFNWPFHLALLRRIYPGIDPHGLTLGEFYDLMDQVVPTERWISGESEPSAGVQGWVAAAKAGQITPETPQKSPSARSVLQQQELLRRLGIVKAR